MSLHMEFSKSHTRAVARISINAKSLAACLDSQKAKSQEQPKKKFKSKQIFMQILVLSTRSDT